MSPRYSARFRVCVAAGLFVAAGTAAWVPSSRVDAQTGPPLLEARVRQGRLSGVLGRSTAIAVFKGVPYAVPPVGNLRWREPQSLSVWSGVRAANEYSPSCIQSIYVKNGVLPEPRAPWTVEFFAAGDVSEDCLYLNIWTGARAATERRPVLVYIHGGANVEGSGSVPSYDGEGLASKGLVVVNINYRLGILGYFGHAELTKESPHRASGNYGLLDQIAAVKWVHENIAAFGGDPTRITVAGQSAGAGAVHSLTVSPLAAGRFHRTIAQSGSSLNALRGARRPLADLEADGARFTTAKGATSLADLRAMPWQQIVAPVTPAPAQPFRWSAVADGYALSGSAGDVFAAGKQNDVPMLTGSNADESGASPQPTATVATYTAQARQRYGADADAFLALYPAATDADAKVAQNTSARDTARTSTHLWALERAKTAKTPVFTYYFTHPIPGPEAHIYGAFHTAEVPYLRNSLATSPRPFTAVDHRVADVFSSYIVNFVSTGDPNGTGSARWDAVSPQAQTTMEIGERVGTMPVAGSAEKFDIIKRGLMR